MPNQPLEWILPETYQFRDRPVRYGITGHGPDLVVVHGTPWSSFNMRHIIAAMSKKFKVHYYDLIGYGQSDLQAGDVSLGVQNEVLGELLTHWNLDDPAIVGHDFGGATVLRTHLLNGIKFRKIVLIDPVALSPWGSPFFAAFYRQIAQANSKYTDRVQSQYSQITQPVMILWGEQDVWIPVAQGQRLHEMIPGSVFHQIPDAGHLVIEERPNKLIEKILPFLMVSDS